MSQQGQPAGAGRGRAAGGWRQPRLLLAAGLLALAAVALRGRLAAPGLTGPFRHDGLPVGIALEAVLACLMAALMVRHSRAPRGALIAARLRMLLTYVVGAGLIAIPAVYVLSRTSRLRLRPRPVPKQTGSPHQHGLLHAGGGSVSGLIVLIVLLVLVVAAVIYVVARFIASRSWAWERWRRGAASVAFEADADVEESDLREAVESGQSALRQVDDARAAIIACYMAMERSLADAGTARAVAETPDELLARAAAQGLIRTGAAAWLTSLFYEARFSSHPLPAQRRAAAELALAELVESLADLGPGPRHVTGADA
jgi:Domain of unknown function (DUF4129)